jgi:hypothetical protein
VKRVASLLGTGQLHEIRRCVRKAAYL